MLYKHIKSVLKGNGNGVINPSLLYCTILYMYMYRGCVVGVSNVILKILIYKIFN